MSFPALQVLAPAVIILGSAMVRTDRRLVGALRAANAFGTESAVSLENLSGWARMRLDRLVTGAVVVRLEDDRYFLDEHGWNEYRLERRRRAATAVAVVLFAAGLVLILSR